MGIERFKPEIALVTLKVGLAVKYISAKYAMADGIAPIVFVTYQELIGALLIVPIAYFKERTKRPPLTFTTFCQIFGISLLGMALVQTLFYTGMSYTGSTFATAMNNLVPVTTFAIAALLRLEEATLKTIKGKAKVLGTIVCVSGAMIMTLYKGPPITILTSGDGVSLLGPFCLLASILCCSAWLTLQVGTILSACIRLMLLSMVDTPALQSGIGGLQTLVLAWLIKGFSAEKWIPRWNLNILTYVYSGLMGPITAFIIIWCVQQRGSVFVATFFPLTTIFTAFLECTIFHYTLHVGSLIGATIIIVGLYSVLWGKAEQKKESKEMGNSHEHIENRALCDSTPLLASYNA